MNHHPHRPTPPDQPVDLAIIGGGINGVALAREAIARGKTVCLFEKGDIGSGTSSRSSKMLHGGLRYLEHFQFRLVFEALRERTLQLDLAPHLSRATSFVIPVYRGASRGKFWIRLGIFLYDLLSGRKKLGKSQGLSQADISQRLKGIREEGLVGGGLYFDGVMDDARICLANFIDSREWGQDSFTGLSYTQVNKIDKETLFTLQLTDLITGKDHEVKAHKVIRALGPWADEQSDQSLLSPSKGSHIVLPALDPNGKNPNGILLTHSKDNRVFFVVPWMGKTIVGTTESPFEDTPDDPQISVEETEYLFKEFIRLFPGHDFTPADILATYSGVRPLAKADTSNGSTGKISREHRLVESKPGLYSLVGGKYTNYRAVAEETIEELYPESSSNATRTRPLTGGEEGPLTEVLPKMQSEFPDVESDRLELLYSRYGCRMREVLSLTQDQPHTAEPIDQEKSVLQAEVIYSILNEEVFYPEDFITRRSHLRYQKNNGREAYDLIEKLIVETLSPECVPKDLEEAKAAFFKKLDYEDQLRDRLAECIEV